MFVPGACSATDVRTLRMKDLMHYERYVNDRFATSAPPAVSSEYLPETGGSSVLLWRRVPTDHLEVYGIDDEVREQMMAALTLDDAFLLPVHPLDYPNWPEASLVPRGSFEVSASYRTVWYRAEAEDSLGAVAEPDEALMIKLHLAAPLPGIPGDRRLTAERVETSSATRWRSKRCRTPARQLG